MTSIETGTLLLGQWDPRIVARRRNQGGPSSRRITAFVIPDGGFIGREPPLESGIQDTAATDECVVRGALGNRYPRLLPMGAHAGSRIRTGAFCPANRRPG